MKLTMLMVFACTLIAVLFQKIQNINDLTIGAESAALSLTILKIISVINERHKKRANPIPVE